MIAIIDPHVHCRDGRQAYKTTIAEVLQIASNQGVAKIFDMPNTDPPIINRQGVIDRLRLLLPHQRGRGRYFLYIGATANPEQIEEAVKCWQDFPEVIGIKLFAGQSVGDLAVPNEENQKKIYEKLARLGYSGVLTVHCEREKDLQPIQWDPSEPVSHSLARPKKAEINSVANQIEFAKTAGFPGNLHICHISCPESVELVDKARKEIRITCGVTPHHLIWDETVLRRPTGLFYKVNPPLRPREDVERLRQLLKEGKIDWIESDHAPHHWAEKIYPPHLSGIPSLLFYGNFVRNTLPDVGLSPEQISALTFNNIVRTFGKKAE